MATFVADCPRCRTSKIAFDVRGQNYRVTQYGWQNWWEIFCVCPNCSKATIFVVAASTDGDSEMRKLPPLQIEKISLNQIFRYEGYISLKDTSSISPPEFVEGPLLQAFVEGSTCMTVQCWNAAGTMFRLCVDIVTRPLLPPEDASDGPNRKQRRDLGLRLPWLFEKKLLPMDLFQLSQCVRDDGNDGAHAGTLGNEDAEDLLDFTTALLERLVSEPERIKRAEQRRTERRRPRE